MDGLSPGSAAGAGRGRRGGMSRQFFPGTRTACCHFCKRFCRVLTHSFPGVPQKKDGDLPGHLAVFSLNTIVQTAAYRMAFLYGRRGHRLSQTGEKTASGGHLAIPADGPPASGSGAFQLKGLYSLKCSAHPPFPYHFGRLYGKQASDNPCRSLFQ